MAEDDELIAEASDVLSHLATQGHLELASSRSPSSLAAQLVPLLERHAELSIGDWLIDQPEVTELYLDSDEVTTRFSRLFTRMAKDNPPPAYDATLANAILRQPDDTRARLVYADWLSERSDPRGELIVLQIKLAEATPGTAEHTRLEQAEAMLLKRFRRHFFGDLPHDDATRCELKFRYGFFDEARVADGALLLELLSLESARFLRRIQFDADSLSSLDELFAKTPLPRSINTLILGERSLCACGSKSVASGTVNLAMVTRGLEHLAHLDVAATKIVWSGFEAPALRELALRGSVLHLRGSSSGSPLMSLPALEQLDLRVSRLKDDDDGANDRSINYRPGDGEVSIRLMRRLFDVRPPCNLSHLRLSSEADLRTLLASPLASQIRTLDLAEARVSEDVLLGGAKSLAALQSLDLRGTAHSMTKALGDLCTNVLVGPYPLHDPRAERDDGYNDDEGDGEDDDDDEGDADHALPSTSTYEESEYDEDDRTADDGTESDDATIGVGQDDEQADEDGEDSAGEDDVDEPLAYEREQDA